MQDIEKQFDLEIRSILSDAEESVSPGVWSAVSAGLDAAAAAVARRARIVRMRRWAGAVATIAAAIAGIIILLPDNSSNLINNHDSFAVVRTPELITPDLTPAGDIRLAQRTAHVKTSPSPSEFVPTSVEEAVRQTEVPEPATYSEPEPETYSEPKAEKQPQAAPAKPAEVIDDASALNKLAFEETKKSRRLIYRPGAVSAGGMVGNNNLATQPSVGPRRVKASAPTETGITEINSQSSFGLPVSFGVQAKVRILPGWELASGLEYSLLTRKFVGTYTDVEAGTPSVTTDIFNTQHYLGIPLYVYYNILDSKSVRFYSFVGGMGEINLANNYEIQTDPVTHFSKRCEKYQLSAAMGIGTEFMVSDHIGIYFDPSIRYYFKNDQPRSVRTQQPLILTLEAGVRFNF